MAGGTVPFRVGPLPAEAMAASVQFHAEVLPRLLMVLEVGARSATLVFDPADHTHTGWRLAVVQQLARRHAPVRINAIASGDEAAIAATLEYIAAADGLTGQLLPVIGIGTDKVPYSSHDDASASR
ncbi:MAG TPA: hypothetical protein VJM34_12760 [Novosphingobium sp.]|nr:hypothetical protein [Novosphingobium sp.]